MTSAIELLSKILDKDGVKYARSGDERIKVTSNNCETEIIKAYKETGYMVTSDCKIKNDQIKNSSGATAFVENFELLRRRTDELFIFAHSNENTKRAGEVGFTINTKTKYSESQEAEIQCDDNKCRLIKGRNWKD